MIARPQDKQKKLKEKKEKMAEHDLKQKLANYTITKKTFAQETQKKTPKKVKKVIQKKKNPKKKTLL